MEITKVSIINMPPEKNFLGFASVVIDDCLEINSLGIYTLLSGDGIRLTFPARKLGNGQYKFYCRPINKEFEQQVVKSVQYEIERLGIFKFKTNEAK